MYNIYKTYIDNVMACCATHICREGYYHVCSTALLFILLLLLFIRSSMIVHFFQIKSNVFHDGLRFHYSITLINRIQGNPHTFELEEREKLTVNDTSGAPQLTSFIGTVWCKLDTYLHFQRNFTFCCRVFFFFRFPPTAKQFHFSKQQQQKRTITTQFRFLYGASPCRSRKFRQRENTVWVRFELNFCFVFPGVVLFFVFFPNWRSSVESLLLYRNKRKKESVISFAVDWITLCVLTGWDAEIREKKERMINDEPTKKKKRFLFFSFQTGTAYNAMNRFL